MLLQHRLRRLGQLSLPCPAKAAHVTDSHVHVCLQDRSAQVYPRVEEVEGSKGASGSRSQVGHHASVTTQALVFMQLSMHSETARCLAGFYRDAFVSAACCVRACATLAVPVTGPMRSDSVTTDISQTLQATQLSHLDPLLAITPPPLRLWHRARPTQHNYRSSLTWAHFVANKQLVFRSGS